MSEAIRTDHVDEDQARRALIDTCLRFAPLGLNQGKSGNASLRWHRGAEAGMLITPSGLAYELTSLDDIVWVPFAQPAAASATLCDPGSSDRFEGRWPPRSAPDDAPLQPPDRYDGRRIPSSEWRMHRDLYGGRDEARAIVHVHSPYATSLACLPAIQARGIPAFHYMIALAGGDDIRCARYATFGTQALSDAVLDALAGRRACLLANHGQIAFGASLEQALALALELETLARQYAQARQLGEPVLLDAAEMERVLRAFERYGR